MLLPFISFDASFQEQATEEDNKRPSLKADRQVGVTWKYVKQTQNLVLLLPRVGGIRPRAP